MCNFPANASYALSPPGPHVHIDQGVAEGSSCQPAYPSIPMFTSLQSQHSATTTVTDAPINILPCPNLSRHDNEMLLIYDIVHATNRPNYAHAWVSLPTMFNIKK